MGFDKKCFLFEFAAKHFSVNTRPFYIDTVVVNLPASLLGCSKILLSRINPRQSLPTVRLRNEPRSFPAGRPLNSRNIPSIVITVCIVYIIV